MKCKVNMWVAPAAAAIIGVLGASGQELEISRTTIDGGGEMFSTGGDFELSGTIGQADAGEVMTGDEFELTGGFWFRIPPGDCEDDGDVDLNDFEAFEECLTGPDAPVVDAECRCFDVDRNNVVDLADLARIQTTFTSQ
ncbi:MAG: hypothetical protein ACYTFA_19370 [Planctomycetota bacterium]|jgi:hypothetical protein